MGINLTNKRVDIIDIIKIAEMLNRRCKFYRDIEAEENRKIEEAKLRDEYYHPNKYAYGNIKFMIQFNNHETLSRENELDWFKETLLVNAKNINDVSIFFSGSEDDKRESLNITFTHDRIGFDVTTTNMYDNSLAHMVEDYLNKLPPRFDDLVKNDGRRKMVPALTISIPLGIIVSFVLLFLVKFNVLTASIAITLTSGIALSAIFLVVAFIGSLLIPTKNNELYKNIKFETYYAGYDENRHESIHKNDYEEYKSRCEVAIGENAHMPEVRQKIEANYNKAKKVVKIELIIAVVAIALFFIL